jgi:hypothetical protein
MIAALKDVVECAQAHVTLQPGDVVVDIGSNDGTLLRHYPSDLYRLGFDPSNIHADGDLHLCNSYFPTKSNHTLAPAKPKIITSVAMFYDLDDPNSFVSAIKDWLHPEGVWVCQFQGYEEMLSGNGFDNICHEHLTYIPKTCFVDLMYRHGLDVRAITQNSTNGGSVRYVVKHSDHTPTPHPHRYKHPSPSWHVTQLTSLGEFIDTSRAAIHKALTQANRYSTCLGYGASTKGNTLLQVYNIDHTHLSHIADRNPDKWGLRTVGTRIPIISELDMRQRDPEYLFVLPWHFIDSFTQRELAFLHNGGQFIVPLPELRLIGAP